MNQDLKKTLWAAADKLRSSMDAAEYKHIVLGLIFLKYISDAFTERREALLAAFADPANDLHLPDSADHAEMLEERDYYTMANVFWVPEKARWETIRAQAKQPDIGTRIDAALDAIEADIASRAFNLSPSMYIPGVAVDAPDEQFSERMAELTEQLSVQLRKTEQLTGSLISTLERLGYVV